MKAVIAIDSFKGSMDSIEAGEAAEKGIRRVFTDCVSVSRWRRGNGTGFGERA